MTIYFRFGFKNTFSVNNIVVYYKSMFIILILSYTKSSYKVG